MIQADYFIEYAVNGKAPTIAEFVAVLSKMELSYQKEL